MEAHPETPGINDGCPESKMPRAGSPETDLSAPGKVLGWITGVGAGLLILGWLTDQVAFSLVFRGGGYNAGAGMAASLGQWMMGLGACFPPAASGYGLYRFRSIGWRWRLGVLALLLVAACELVVAALIVGFILSDSQMRF